MEDDDEEEEEDDEESVPPPPDEDDEEGRIDVRGWILFHWITKGAEGGWTVGTGIPGTVEWYIPGGRYIPLVAGCCTKTFAWDDNDNDGGKSTVVVVDEDVNEEDKEVTDDIFETIGGRPVEDWEGIGKMLVVLGNGNDGNVVRTGTGTIDGTGKEEEDEEEEDSLFGGTVDEESISKGRLLPVELDDILVYK